MKPGDRVQLSAYGRRVFSVACAGMATTGKVIKAGPYAPCKNWFGYRTNVSGRMVLVIRDGETEARSYNAEFWEPVA